jgi:hypothetical protein
MRLWVEGRVSGWIDGVHALKAGFQEGENRERELVVDDVDRRTHLVFVEVFA